MYYSMYTFSKSRDEGGEGEGEGEGEESWKRGERGQMQRPKLVMQRTCITRLAGSDAFLVRASWWCNNPGVCWMQPIHSDQQQRSCGQLQNFPVRVVWVHV